MAYENYLFVSWTDGTPLTGTRLAQMSTNIEQVKDVVDDKATGVIRLNEVTSAVPNTTPGYTDFAEHEIIYLRDDSTTGGSDRRVSIGANRYYKVNVNIPSIAILAAGGEDAKYTLNVYSGANIADSGKLLLGSWDVSPPPYTYINVATLAPVIGSEILKTTTYPTKLGAGTFSIVKSTTTAVINQSFFASVARTVGASSNNATGWRVDAGVTSPIQFSVEDAGGV